MAQTKKSKPDFEKSLQQLEKIVDALEGGELTLEQSLKQFEAGIKLARDCQASLQDAEQKVQMLVGKELKDLDPESLDED